MTFARLFRKLHERIGLGDGLRFDGLHRTALSEIGNSGATETEIVSISGHWQGSTILNTYVVPDKASPLPSPGSGGNKAGSQ